MAEVPVLQGSPVVVREAIDAAHLLAAPQEQFAQVSPDEPGRAGHEHRHGAPPGSGRTARPHRSIAAITPKSAHTCRKWSVSWNTALIATAAAAPARASGSPNTRPNPRFRSR